METPVHFKRVALIGLGLEGSSLAWAMKAEGLADRIVGTARTEATRARALELGFIDAATLSAAEAVVGADLVIICTPLGVVADVCKEIAGAASPGAIITDVGSCKASVARAFREHLPTTVHAIPGHPVAGTENSGPDSGYAELFRNRYCILTPEDDTDPEALARLKALWEAIGGIVEIMEPEHHDRVLAITSHLPHLIAYTIVGTASDLENQLKREHADDKELVSTKEVIRFSAGGFRDFTRIAGSDPVMWRDIFLENREASLEMLGRFTEDLLALQRAVRWGDGQALEDWFTRTREVRRGVIEERQAGTFIADEPD